ncbi:SDR family NAD(P)-dependent oxidoreductase [Aquimarina agarilytica]|uniref:SDR family NAD(P)-dependent oxidoreductase n=1 Tax=Aquimarina agarilytica TaxID=1087449 RepID=UPI00028858EF|nr:SDR family oxidoreductase [Aquimarina agarilytica]
MKNILLIGGSYGIGNEIAKQMKAEANVIVASRTNNDLPEDVTHIPFDAAKNSILEIDLPEVIDGLVYCPGTINLKPFSMLKPEVFESDLQLNFLSLVKILKELHPKLKASTQASIVVFSTVAVKVGMPFHTSVAAAKGALEGFSKSLAAEWAPQIRVNVIAPSLTNTPLAKRLVSNEAKIEKMNERHPLKRIGQSEDIAHMASFLLSDKSSWITGQVMGVDGGTSTLNLS